MQGSLGLAAEDLVYMRVLWGPRYRMGHHCTTPGNTIVGVGAGEGSPAEWNDWAILLVPLLSSDFADRYHFLRLVRYNYIFQVNVHFNLGASVRESKDISFLIITEY